jgi:CheY-like chemotaxis protein
MRERRGEIVSPAVLIVEDDEDHAQQLSDLLERHGYYASVARNGREALDRLLAEPEPQLVLLDLDMPVMGGWELLTLMRCYARLSRIPVVLVTAHPVGYQARPHFDALVRKPVRPDQILDAVAHIRLGGRSAMAHA